jgi:phosphoglycerol transferase MdoB-like AlkP superfamily enzyme
MRSTAPFALALCFALIALRINLFWQTTTSPFADQISITDALFGLLYDFSLAGMFWMIAAVIHRALPVRKRKLADVINGLLLGIVIIICVSLDQYYMIAGQALDSTVFHFSPEEIWIIAGVEERLSWKMLFSLVALIVGIFFSIRFMRKVSESKIPKKANWLPVLALVQLLAIPYSVQLDPSSLAREGLVNNRLIYFLHSSLKALLTTDEKKQRISPDEFAGLDQAWNGGYKTKAEWPVWHDSNEKSTWIDAFRLTDDRKPPNIVIIIVESMSSDFFGERGRLTGCLMPFLDSLSQQSLYYPNGFSSSQRTHHALPAILSSVPHVMDGNVFQQIAYPNHWGISGLLKEHYFSRFYCGVPLEYLNMRGFMNYHNFDYLVNRWSPQNERINKQINSSWGYPDEALFNQGLSDIQPKEAKGKSLLDVFLTISTHDPWIYPESERYAKQVRQKSKGIKADLQRKIVYNQAHGLGSFLYTDAQLRKFFGEWKKRKDYERTIFIITGDHGSELYPVNKLTKYNVPIVVYSPLLLKPKKVTTIVSHLDITPTIIAFLRDSYRIKQPSQTPFIGRQLPFRNEPVTDRAFVFMTNKLRSNELFYKGFAYLENRLYQVNENLEIKEANNPKLLKYLGRQIQLFQPFVQYTVHQNKLVPLSHHDEWYGAVLWKERKRFQVDAKRINLKRNLNYLGTFQMPRNLSKKIRVQLFVDVTCNSLSELRKLPDFLLTTSADKWFRKEKMLFRAVRPALASRFRAGKPNKVVYTLEFDRTQVEKLKNSKSFAFNWYKEKIVPCPFFNKMEWVVYSQ